MTAKEPVPGGEPGQPDGGFRAAYLGLLDDGELQRRAREARRRLKECDLCAHSCGVDRFVGTEGAACRTGERAVVHSYGPHHGEERPLSGSRGSGTIFFSGCNLRCLYCQNWEISHRGVGREVTTGELAGLMLSLQEQGCHNINFVSPSHVVAPVLAATHVAAERGLRLPLVYNTGGYDGLEALALLDGVIDIYMPDMKYGDTEIARKYSKVRDYAGINRATVQEMHRQVGDLVLDSAGIARRGLLVRHLVLPEDLAGTEKVLTFLADVISSRTYLNLMDQYRPCYRASGYPELARRITPAKYTHALELADRHGLRRLDRPWARAGA
jgi:putative pyruvate formate lyase activating enzyme